MSANGSTHFDVAVVGAGPAGGCAALELARRGFSVALLEKATLPRYKTCGGGVLHRAFKLLPPEIETAVECRFNSVALNFLGTTMNFVATRSQPLVRMAMRADLDGRLAQLAEAAGARLIEGCRVTGVREHAGHVEILSNRETIRAQFVIAADGIHSVVAKSAGWPELPALAPALEQEIFLLDADFARFGATPRFDFNAIDAGYAWVFPKRAHLSVGIMSTRRVCPDLQTKLADYLQQLGITRIQKIEKHGWLIPLAPRGGPLARERVLLVGDAAGLVDPVLAEGITHAVWSGQLAAKAIMEGTCDVAKVGAIYQSLLEEKILTELRAARFLAKILYRHPRIRHGAFRIGGQRLCDFMADVVMGERSYRYALKSPSSYFKVFGF